MAIKLNIFQPTKERNLDVIYRDINLDADVGIVKSNELNGPTNLKDLNTAVNFEAIKNSLINLITTFQGQKICNNMN
jgi:hypothetical protein